jgi:hypothetical protein
MSVKLGLSSKGRAWAEGAEEGLLNYEAETREGWAELHNGEYHDWRAFRNIFRQSN